MTCEHSDNCLKEPESECGYCGNAFCGEHLLFFDHSEIEKKFFCYWCCKLFESERGSW